jgi:undecaprenyl diphosphate synthase
MNDLIERMPRHVAIIMDGNGRWATRRGEPRTRGHEAGAESVRRVLECAEELGLEVLTLYAFSTENWNRPRAEIAFLMRHLRRFLRKHTSTLVEHDARLNPIGALQDLPARVQKELERAVEATRHCTSTTLNLALNYGARSELARAARHIARRAAAGELDPESVDEDALERHLYTAGQPDPDLIIRTAGEMRLSNFLLWQASYAEIYVTETLWPDFDRAEMLRALRWYSGRSRRFGALDEAQESGHSPQRQ